MGKLTRRAAISGAAVSSAAFALPVSATFVQGGEHPWEKVRRLSRDLSHALKELESSGKGSFRAEVVSSALDPQPVMFCDLQSQTPRERVDYHAKRLFEAAKAMDPTIKNGGILWSEPDRKFHGFSVSRART